jgi:ArsR family transcriptional regulator
MNGMLSGEIVERESLALKMKALSHPVRLKIIQILKVRGCVCSEIVEMLQIAQATVSQHLKVLKEAGFINGVNYGTKTCYSLNHEALNAFKESVRQL